LGFFTQESVILENKDIFWEELPCELPKDKGIRHEIDFKPGTKYCVTRQWPLPKEQVAAIDAFFAERFKAGHVRENKSPHCSPTFLYQEGHRRVAHCTCVQQVERRDDTGSNTDTTKGCHDRWHVQQHKSLVLLI
jgi:hypothetical protein